MIKKERRSNRLIFQGSLFLAWMLCSFGHTAAPQDISLSSGEKMSQALSNSIKISDQILKSYDGLLPQLDTMSKTIDEVRIQLRRRRRTKKP